MAPVSGEQQMNVSPEEVKKGMEPWITWFKKAGTAIVEAETPLRSGMHFTKNGEKKSIENKEN